MKIEPSLETTFVSKHSKAQVLEIIAINTHRVDSDIVSRKAVFNGQIGTDGFRISLIVRTPQNGLPLTIGTVENTSLGSLIFIKCQLFPAAKLYLKFSTLLCMAIGGIFLLLANSIKIALIALLIATVNYYVLSLNFQKKAQQTIETLKDVLE